MSCKLRPIMDRLVLRRHTEDAAGAIVYATPKRLDRGTVLAVGPGRINRKTGGHIPIAIAVGDVVELMQASGKTVRVDGEDYWIVGEPEILAVVES